MAGFCHAQSIKGNILDSLGKPVTFASVNLKSGNLIIAYTTSGDKGAFTLAVPADADQSKLQLEVSSIGFKKEVRAVTSLTTPYIFKLGSASNQLKTVTIKDKNPRLRVSGDTISYKVSEFSSPQDRVIGDVIKKLPGIDVDKNGKISYNGKSISNLYIGGDNLLDDKYNIATSSIPNGVVDQVQVMENHQPIKMLKDKVVSEDVAINLTMKKDAKVQLIGQETVGAGLPGNYYGELNAMAFKDKYKAINYLKGNNVGNDISSDLISHNFSAGADAPSTLLSLGTAGDPDLPRNRYLFNKSGLANLNNLFNLKKDVQLRANISYLRDDQRQDYSKENQTIDRDSIINFSETQRNNRRLDALRSQFLINVNSAKYYLNNSFSADYIRNSALSGLVANNRPVNQNFTDNQLNLTNTFNMMNTLKNGSIWELYSTLNHSNEPERLLIDPNHNPGVFNDSLPYRSLAQRLNIPNWSTNNYVSYRIPNNGGITQSYRAGFGAIKQNLTSDLTVTQLDGSANPFSMSSVNNVDWRRDRVYTSANFDYPGQKWKVNVSLPLTLMETRYSDLQYQLKKELTRLYFDPQAYVKFQSGIENYITASYNFRNSIGGMQDIYRGTILSNYRNLSANNADLTERQSQTAALSFNYRKAITLFFFGLTASYNHQYANTISSTVLSNDISQRVVLPFDNKMDAWNFGGNISKYSFGLRTTFSASLGYTTSKLNQLQNGVTLPFTTISQTAGFGTDTKIADRVNFAYRGSYTRTNSRSSAIANTASFERLQQSATINYNPLDNFFTSLSGDHYYTHQPGANDLNYTFADASLRYKFKKAKIDLELTAQNLLDTKTYSAVYLSANVYTSSTYRIPGRIILGKVMFTL
ncbi:carboxypeptidase-like regulatory domain-containing protein [Mucilaginibacter myungsuensis]